MISGFGGVGSVAASGAGACAGSGAAAAGCFVGVTSDFFGTLAAAFFVAGRLRGFAALRLAAFALRALAALLLAALRFRVAAVFFPALLRLELMSPPCGMGLNLKPALYARPAFLAGVGSCLGRERTCHSRGQRWRYRDRRDARRFTSSCDPRSYRSGISRS